MTDLVLATGNLYKLNEIKSMLCCASLTLRSLRNFQNLPVIVEDGKTFKENAIKKASEIARYLKTWTLADDSGLEVQSLGGLPGVRSARYAGNHGDDAANNKKLLEMLKGQQNRAAQFVCAMALSDPEGNTTTVQGHISGTIIEDERGKNGFGYDPLFLPHGHMETFAEMKAKEKNNMSHRAIALNKMKAFIFSRDGRTHASLIDKQ